MIENNTFVAMMMKEGDSCGVDVHRTVKVRGSVSQQGVRASIGHPNPKKPPSRIPILHYEEFLKISNSSI